MYIHTFIISTMVFKAIKVMTKYSNFVDTTSFQILYLIVFLFFGMYRLVGRAFTAKSIHCFCYKRKKTPSFQTFSSQRDQSFPTCAFIFLQKYCTRFLNMEMFMFYMCTWHWTCKKKNQINTCISRNYVYHT